MEKRKAEVCHIDTDRFCEFCVSYFVRLHYELRDGKKLNRALVCPKKHWLPIPDDMDLAELNVRMTDGQ